MEDASNTDLEQELKAQLERELEERLNAASQDTAPAPAAEPTTSADHARAQLEDELQRELDAHMEKPATEPEAGSRAEMEAKLQADIDVAMAEHDQAGTPVSAGIDIGSEPVVPSPAPVVAAPTPVAPAPVPVAPAPVPVVVVPEPVAPSPSPPAPVVAAPVPVAPPNAPVSMVIKPAPQPAADSAKKKKGTQGPGASGNRKRKTGMSPAATAGRKKGKGKGKSKTMGATRGAKTRATRQLSDQDVLIMEEKAKIDARMRKLKWFLYPSITLLCVPFLIIIMMTKCIKERSPSTNNAKVTYTKSDKKVHVGGNGNNNHGTIPKATGPTEVVDLISLRREVYRLVDISQYQSAVEKIRNFKVAHSADAGEARNLHDKIVARFIDLPKSGSENWRGIKENVLTLRDSDDADSIQEAIDILGELLPDFFLLSLATAEFVLIDGDLRPCIRDLVDQIDWHPVFAR